MILNKENNVVDKERLIKALNIGFDFKLDSCVQEKNTKQMNNESLFELPIEGIELNKLLDTFDEEVLPYCTNFSCNNFMGFPDAGNSVAGLAGAIISDFLQQNLINSTFCAPIATHLEIAVITWFRQLLGYKIKKIENIWDVGGIITYGGTGSNATAMLLARENFKPNTMNKGVSDLTGYKVIIPKGIGHYSISSSCMWIGLGNSIIECPTKNYKYDLTELEKILKQNKGHVMAVVVYVGDSRTMTIENLKEVYKLVKSIDKRIWLHADACHGFSLAFSDKLKEKIKDINLYDSISTDPHKVLAIPYCVSALLVKNPRTFKKITSTSDLIMQEPFAFGQITPFIGSKSWVSLKLWFALKNMGIKRIGKMIERRCDMANYLKAKIEDSNKFVLLNEVNINSVVFAYVDNKNEDLKQINNRNEKIYERILCDGKYYLHKFTINDDLGILSKNKKIVALRYMSGNDNITHDDIDDMLKYIEKIAREVENNE